MKILTTLILIGLITVPVLTLGAGIQVSPSRLEILIRSKEIVTQTITVVNPTADVQIFEVYADDYENFIESNPKSFTLESGTKKNIIISFNPDISKQSSEQITTTLSVTGKPLSESKFSVGTGVKIPINITVDNSQARTSINSYLLLTLAMVIGLAIIIFIKFKPKKH